MHVEARDDQAGATTPTRWYRPARSSATTRRPAHLLQGIGRQVSEVASCEPYPPCTGHDVAKRLMDRVRRAVGTQLMSRLLDEVQIEIDVGALDHGNSIHPTWSHWYTFATRPWRHRGCEAAWAGTVWSGVSAPRQPRVSALAGRRHHRRGQAARPIRPVLPSRHGRAVSKTGTTGLEPATSGVTGQRSNRLSYVPKTRCRSRVWHAAP